MARFPTLALRAPEAGEAHGGAEFPGFGLLLTCKRERVVKIFFRFRYILVRLFQCYFASDAINLGVPLPFLRCVCRRHGFANGSPSIVESAKVCIGPRQS